MSEELEGRITELEIRFSHLILQVEELNDVVVDCNHRIDRLGRENQKLHDIISNMTPELEESPDE